MRIATAGIIVGFLLAAVAVAVGARWLGPSRSDVHAITVTGESRLVGEPDLARVMFGVTKSGKTVAEAQQRMTDVISKVIDTVKDAGVAKEDMATSDISIDQEWDYKKKAPKGYTVASMLTITVRNVQHVGRVIDLAVANGLNRLEGVSYDVRSPEWRRKALREALDNSREKAEAMAVGLGRRLGRALSVREAGERQSSPADEYYTGHSGEFADARSRWVSTLEFEMPRTRSLPGRRAMTVAVEVVYQL